MITKNERDKKVNHLCLKIARLIPIYKAFNTELKRIKHQMRVASDTRSIKEWNRPFYTRYKIVNTEVKHCVKALEKHVVWCTDNEAKIVRALIYKAIMA